MIALEFGAGFIVFKFANALRAAARTVEAHVQAVCGKVRGGHCAALWVNSPIVRPLFRRPARPAVCARFGH